MAENQNIEWKESWRDEYLKWICGFANAQGGKIYIGMNDDGKVVGIQNSKRLLEDIPNKVQMSMGILVDVNLYTEDLKDYIEIVIYPAAYPVSYKGEYHYRTGSTKQLLVGNALTQFLLKKTGSKWDAIPVDNVSVSDLDKESFDIFRREAKRTKRMTEEDLQLSDEELLNHLGLFVDGKLKRAAVLLFHRNPEKWFTGVYTKIGKFSGSEIEYMDEVHGSLMIQADRIIDLIYLKYLKISISYDKDTRVETYPYAREAIREAVFNALCHSNWAESTPIQIHIDEKQMMISNCSAFPKNWTADTLMADHGSMPYNPDIANTFYRAGFIEAWGRGIKRICDACESLGAEKPEYIIHGEDVMVKFQAYNSEKETDVGQGVGQDVGQGVGQGDRANQIIALIKNNSNISKAEIAVKLGVSEKTIERIMKTMKNVTFIGSGYSGHWEISDNRNS